jgi:hypothetical protein
MVMLALAAVAVVLGGVVLLTGGKDTVPISTVANAAEATNSAGGFKLAIDGSFEVPQMKRTLPMKGSGAIDPKARRGRLVFNSAGALAPAGGQTGPIEQVFDGDVIYMKMPAVTQQLGAKKPWLRVDIKAAGRALGLDPSQLGQLGSNDPRQMLDQIRSVSGEVEELGSEKVRGVDTTHYRASVNLRKYPDRLPQQDREQARVAVERLIDQTGSATYPMELWIDDKELVRRVRIAYSFKVPGQEDEADFSMRMEFFDFGSPIDVAPPPAKDVQDLTDLARQLQSAAGQQGAQGQPALPAPQGAPGQAMPGQSP